MRLVDLSLDSERERNRSRSSKRRETLLERYRRNAIIYRLYLNRERERGKSEHLTIDKRLLPSRIGTTSSTRMSSMQPCALPIHTQDMWRKKENKTEEEEPETKKEKKGKKRKGTSIEKKEKRILTRERQERQTRTRKQERKSETLSIEVYPIPRVSTRDRCWLTVIL